MKSVLPRLVEFGAIASAVAFYLGLSSIASAQQPDAQKTQRALEEVTVTGTLLTNSGLVSPTPVTAVSATALESMEPGQLIDSVGQLPQFYADNTPRQGGGGHIPGGGNLNLRGAGVNRTLVLLDGHRIVPSNRFGIADIGTFPEMLVQRVEAVTGGASAAYGTDAVAGVVNFRLNTAFSGLKSMIQGGTTTYRDGDNYKFGVAYGTDFGQHSHVIASAEFYRIDPIAGLDSLKARDYYQLRSQVTNPNPPPTLIIRPFVQPTSYTSGGVILQPGSSLDHTEFLPDGSYQPLPLSGVGPYQALPMLDYGVDASDEIAGGSARKSGFVRFDHEVGDNTSIYFQGLFAQAEIDDVRPNMILYGPWGGRVFADNPFLPDSIRQIMQQEGLQSVGFNIKLPSTKGSVLGRTLATTNNNLFSLTEGFTRKFRDGGFLGGWQLDGYAQYGQNFQLLNQHNGTRVDRLPLAMDAVTDPATGQPVCRVTLFNPGTFDKCVPINLFGGIGNITPNMANYINNPSKIVDQRTTEMDTEVVLKGNLSQGFGQAGPISGAFGLSWREQKLTQSTPNPCDEYPCTIDGVLLSDLGVLPAGLRGVLPESAPNGIPGLRYVPIGFKGDSSSSSVEFSSARAFAGQFNVKEAFFELGIPLLPGGKLNFDPAFRWADYSGSGTVQAWKAGLSWQATEKLRVRATRSQDVRAATLEERYDQTRGGANVRDPENNNLVIGTASFSGGNPDVAPEIGLTSTIGVVYEPLDKFSMTVDWYDINISDAIGQLSSQNVVDGCFNGDQTLCAFVHRDPGTNQIVRVDNLFINLANQRINGIDVELNYMANVGRGSLNWRLFGSRLNENSIQNPGGPKDDRAGDVGTQSLPKNKVTTSLTYAQGPVSVFLQERYIGSGLLDRNLTQGVDIDNNHVNSVVYTDLSFNYRAKNGSWEAYVTVNNLADKAPPPSPQPYGLFGSDEFNGILYDLMGRRYVAGVRLNF